MLDAVEKQSHVRIVPGDRLVQIHQQKLVVDAWVRPVNYTFGNVDAWVAPFRAFEQDDAKLTKPFEETPTAEPRFILGVARVDNRMVRHLAPPAIQTRTLTGPTGLVLNETTVVMTLLPSSP